jgi:hypothetical protein
MVPERGFEPLRGKTPRRILSPVPVNSVPEWEMPYLRMFQNIDVSRLIF